MTKILVIDGYDAAGMASLKAAGATPGGVLYKRMLSEFLPADQIDIVEISQPEPVQIDISVYDGVCWTGSNLFFSNSNAIVQRHIDMCQALFAAGIPQFGSCWAAQLAAQTAGGVVTSNPKGREFGLSRKMLLTEAGQTHPMYTGKPRVFDGFTSHLDIVSTLPKGASVLASNTFSGVQAIAVKHEKGEFWAVQYHPEYDCAEIAGLAQSRSQALINQGTFQDQAGAMTYISEMRTLNADPSRKDISWKYGIDEDVQDKTLRTLEVRNWLAHFFDIV